MVSGIDQLRKLACRSLKSGVKNLIRLPDRLLHPRRRHRARRKLADVSSEARSVTFVCHGNICRSPFAERAFAASLPERARDRLRVVSTGFYPEEGRRSPEGALRAAEDLGVDLSDHRSRSLVLSREDWGKKDGSVVFVMDSEQASRFRRVHGSPTLGIYVLGDFDPKPVSRRGIRDPFGHPQPVFDETFARIQRCVEQVSVVWGQCLSSTHTSVG